jgi:hypothetical protein
MKVPWGLHVKVSKRKVSKRSALDLEPALKERKTP